MVMHKSDFDDSDRARALRRVTALGQIETISRISPTSQRTKVVKPASTATSVTSAAPTKFTPASTPAAKFASASKSATFQAKIAGSQLEPKRHTPGPAEFGRPAKRQEPQPEATSRIIQHFADRHTVAPTAKTASVPTSPSVATKVVPTSPSVATKAAPTSSSAAAKTIPATPSAASKVTPASSATVSSTKSDDTSADASDRALDAALDAAFNATVGSHFNSPAELHSASADDSQSVPTKLPQTLPHFSFNAFKSLKSRLIKLQSSKAKVLQAIKDTQAKATQTLKDTQAKAAQSIKSTQAKAEQPLKDTPAKTVAPIKNTPDKPTKPIRTKPSSAKTQAPANRRAKSKPGRTRKKRNIKDLDVDVTSTVAHRLVLSIIGILVLIVCGGIIVLLNYNTKAQLETKITGLAKTYYEDYFYPNIFSGNISIADVLAEFGESGLTEVTLRQLILTNPNLSSSEIHFLREHCDQETTTVRYYPTDPYDRTSYRTEFNYSCNFDDDLISV